MLTSNNAFEDAFANGAATPAAVATADSESAGYTPPVVAGTESLPPVGAPLPSKPSVDPATVATAPGASTPDPFAAPSTAPPPTAKPVEASHEEAGPRVLVEFSQEDPCKGKEWRAKTYFVISCRVLAANASFSPPVTRDAPHLSAFDTGVRRNDWDRGARATVERRYSELCALRELLVFQFPGLIIPPLPAKKLLQDVETTFNASDAAKLQQYNVELFLREVGRMPELIFFSFFLSGFFMNARQAFLEVTWPAMQQCLTQFRDRTRVIRQCGVRHRSATENARDTVASTTSWLVRGVVGLVSGSTPEKKAEAEAGEGAPTVVEDDEYRLSSLADAQRQSGERWLRVAATLQRRQKVLKKSAELYEKVLVGSNAAALQGQHVAEALDGCKTVIAAAKEQPATTQCAATVQLFDDIAIADKSLLDGRYLNVRRRLAYERNAIDAVLDAIDDVLAVYAYAASPASQETPGRKAALIEYGDAVSKDLRTDYQDRWEPWYRAHMQNLCTMQLTAPRTAHAAKVQHIAAQYSLAAALHESG